MSVQAPKAKAAAVGRVSLAKAPAGQTIFICSKCAKKLPGRPGAKGVRAALKSALKRMAPTRDWGRVRIVQAGCFDLCPKRRQVLASGRTLAKGRLVVVDADLAPDAALDALLSNAAEDRAEDGVQGSGDHDGGRQGQDPSQADVPQRAPLQPRAVGHHGSGHPAGEDVSG